MLCAALAGCATQSTRAAVREPIDAMLTSTEAVEVARDAPDAFAEVVRAAAEAPGEVSADEVRLVFEWAQLRARDRRARARQTAAETRRDAADEARRRIDAQSDTVSALARWSAAARVQSDRAAASAHAQPPADLAARASAAADMRQQAALLLAAAQSLGASPMALRGAQERLARAESDAQTGATVASFASAAAAWRAADALVVGSSEPSPPANHAPVVAAPTDARDDAAGARAGVVFVLRGLFQGDRMVGDAQSRVAALARAVRAHPDGRARVEVIAGGATAALASARARAQSAVLVRALVAAGVARDRVEPVVTGRVQGAADGGDRVEVELIRASAP